MNLRELFKYADHQQRFKEGDIIFAEGDQGDVMYVVLDGKVEVWIKDELIEVTGPGEILGEMALIDSKPRSATAVAISDCRLAAVDEKQFLFMVQQTPFFALQVMRMLVDRLRRRDARSIGITLQVPVWSDPSEDRI